MMLESVPVSFFYKWLTIFPAPLVIVIIFSPLYILASFVKDKVSIGVWVYLWAFYFVPLIYKKRKLQANITDDIDAKILN